MNHKCEIKAAKIFLLEVESFISFPVLINKCSLISKNLYFRKSCPKMNEIDELLKKHSPSTD